MMRMKQVRVRRLAASGFSLMELLIVIMIMGVLLGIAVVNMKDIPNDAKMASAKQEIRTIGLALDMYRMHNALYPTNEQGLKALVEKPAEARKWQTGGYLSGKGVPTDPWGNPYKYLTPGGHGDVDLYSLGVDGRESEDDVGNWMQED